MATPKEQAALVVLRAIETRMKLLGLSLEPGTPDIRTVIREVPSGFLSALSPNGRSPVVASK